MLTSKEKIDSKLIKDMFPNWVDVFRNKYEELTVDVRSADEAPKFELTKKNGGSIEGTLAVHIKNPMNEAIDALIIYFNFTATFNVTLQGRNLTSIVNDLDMKLSKLKPLFDNDEPFENVAKKVGPIKKLLETAIDDFIKMGLELPLSKSIQDI